MAIPTEALLRLRVVIRGAVQGVGFRPFIYRLATQMSLTGWVNNTTQGVFIEVEGPAAFLESFLLRIEREKPPRAAIHSLEPSYLDPVGFSTFEIRHSAEAGGITAIVLPDIATCPDCLREIFDPANRRYRYPFTNCTNCGPRFTIIEALPYDRPNTSMRAFTMCEHCQAEYENPQDRRFHAQPNACPKCGPHLDLWDGAGKSLATHDDALLQTATAIRQGKIVAVKGIGGFHLLVDARNDEAVLRLRQRKLRDEKPFAVMATSLEAVHAACHIQPGEERLLQSPEAPIVLLTRQNSEIAPSVAPGNPYLGVMLPYTPQHALLLAELGFPVVATSGNLSDEPICTDEHDAVERLRGIADLFLVHNRPIVRHVDDSVVRLVAGRELVMRRARGYAPLPVYVKEPLPPVLAVGAHLKNTIAAPVERQVFVSQHIGDLETAPAFTAFERVLADFRTLYDLAPKAIVCDLHPDYLSTRYAQGTGLPVIPVQHHYAHVLACLAENELEPPVLGVSWDGTGYGTDGTIWGGEFLLVESDGFQRVAHLRTFPLPGGEAAVKEPRRVALGLLYAAFGEDAFTRDDLMPLQSFSTRELALVRAMLEKGLNTPMTSSAGRLFDGIASLVGIRQRLGYEGQAAMELEFAATGAFCDESYPFVISGASPLVIDWSPTLQAVIEDLRRQEVKGTIAAKFHNTLVEMLLTVARRASQSRVVLTGGCFQNHYLCERAIQRLSAEGFHPYWHQRIPPNDGGIALGQALAAGYWLNSKS